MPRLRYKIPYYTVIVSNVHCFKYLVSEKSIELCLLDFVIMLSRREFCTCSLDANADLILYCYSLNVDILHLPLVLALIFGIVMLDSCKVFLCHSPYYNS